MERRVYPRGRKRGRDEGWIHLRMWEGSQIQRLRCSPLARTPFAYVRLRRKAQHPRGHCEAGQEMTLPALRLIMADLAKVLPETIHPSSRIRELFGVHPLDDRFEPQIAICDALETATERTIPWSDAMAWKTPGDVARWLEAREAEVRG